MKEIAIMTDNIACIGPEMAQKFGIGIISYFYDLCFYRAVPGGHISKGNGL